MQWVDGQKGHFWVKKLSLLKEGLVQNLYSENEFFCMRKKKLIFISMDSHSPNSEMPYHKARKFFRFISYENWQGQGHAYSSWGESMVFSP